MLPTVVQLRAMRPPVCRSNRKLKARHLGLLTILGLMSGCSSLKTIDEPWLGTDKLKHFAGAALISAAVTDLAEDRDRSRLRIRNEALAVTLSAGAAKEMYDNYIKGTGWSWPDMVWNLFGALAGNALAAQE